MIDSFNNSFMFLLCFAFTLYLRSAFSVVLLHLGFSYVFFYVCFMCFLMVLFSLVLFFFLFYDFSVFFMIG